MKAAIVLLAGCSAPSEPARPSAPITPVVVVDAAPADAARPSFAVWHALYGIDVVETTMSASHVHGGTPASIDGARVNVVVKDRRAHVVTARAVELRIGICRETTWSSTKALRPTGYAVHDWDRVDPIATGTTSVTLPAAPGLYAITIAFAPEDVYQSCTRFAFAIRLAVDGVEVGLEVPLHVKRYESLDRRRPGPNRP